MNYHFRIYYLTKDTETIRKINVSVNGESKIKTDEKGAALLRETERRGFIKIREYKEL